MTVNTAKEINLFMSIMAILVVNTIAMFYTGTKGLELALLTVVTFLVTYVVSHRICKRFIVR